MKKRGTVLSLALILASALLASSCAPEIKPPKIIIPVPQTEQPSPDDIKTPDNLPQTTVPGQTKADFPFVNYGEGQDFLEKPMLFTAWTQNKNFYAEINNTSVSWGPALPANQSEQRWFSDYLNNILEHQVHYIGAYITPMHRSGGSPPPLKEYAAIDIDGNPIYAQKPGATDFKEQYWLNLLDPGWQDILLKDARAMIDMGIQGIVVDEATFNQQVIFKKGGTFDRYSLEGFKHFLKLKYPADQLKSRFKIDNVDTFNFKEYILTNNLRSTWNKEEYPPLPITYEFSQFQLVESARFWKRFAAELKEYSKSRYDREFFFSISASPNFAKHAMPADIMDYLAGEQFYFQQGSAIPKAAVAVKMTQGLTSVTALLVEVNHDLGRLPAKTKNMFKYFFGDIYSGQGKMITDGEFFKTMDGWNYLDNAKVAYDTAEANRYLSFANAHPELFGLDEPARVGFVYSLASCRAGAQMIDVPERNVWTEHDVKGVVEMLLNLNVPCGLVYAGDGELITRTFTRADLDKHKVVILPSVFAASDEEVAAITDYVKNGGNVIQISDFATHDKQFNVTHRLDIEALSTEGEHALGKGKWFSVQEPIGERYYYDKDGQAYQPTQRDHEDPILMQFQKTLYRYYTPEIETTAPITVNVRRYVGDQRVVMHLVNYNYDQTRDSFTPTPSFEVQVTLPAGIEPSKAILYNFESGESGEIELTITEGKATVVVPSLYAYSVLELH